MNQIQPQHHRILAIAPSAKGIGFAVLEQPQHLVDWGVKSAKGDKNAVSLQRAEELIAKYQPTLLVLQDTRDSRRAPRIKKLIRNIHALASCRMIEVALLLRENVNQSLHPDDGATKCEIAQIIAQRFPQELGSRLPPMRKLWQSEDSRMDIFDAVALALTVQQEKVRGLPRA